MSGLSRRDFVVALSATIPFLATPRWVFARSLATRELRFAHTHTGERLTVEYFNGGRYLQDALATINHYLRDFRTGEVHPIDPDLLDLLIGLTGLTGSRQPFQAISGYRSPTTNEMLRHRSEGVAAGSLHMKEQAIDIRLADVPLAKLRNAALAVQRGGVGYYPASDFVHVDPQGQSWGQHARSSKKGNRESAADCCETCSAGARLDSHGATPAGPRHEML